MTMPKTGSSSSLNSDLKEYDEHNGKNITDNIGWNPNICYALCCTWLTLQKHKKIQQTCMSTQNTRIATKSVAYAIQNDMIERPIKEGGFGEMLYLKNIHGSEQKMKALGHSHELVYMSNGTTAHVMAVYHLSFPSCYHVYDPNAQKLENSPKICKTFNDVLSIIDDTITVMNKLEQQYAASKQIQPLRWDVTAYLIPNKKDLDYALTEASAITKKPLNIIKHNDEALLETDDQLKLPKLE